MTTDRLNALADHFAASQFRSVNSKVDGTHVFQRQAFSISKMSMLDTFVIARLFDVAPSPADFVGFSADSMTLSRKFKFGLPTGLFSALVTYPLAIVPDVPEALAAQAAKAAPKHWSAFEFPVVLDARSGELHYYRETPVWGALYYNGFRAEAEALFGV